MPKLPRFGLDRKFRAMGTIAGRNRHEIESAVGKPQSIAHVGPGLLLLQWMHTSSVGAYHIGLLFDEAGVCGGVSHESSV